MNRKILRALERNELVPVIGNDISMIRLLKSEIPDSEALISNMESATEVGDHVEVNINDYLAFKLWHENYLDKKPPSPFSLSNVVEIIIDDQNPDSPKEDDIKADIMFTTKKLTDEQIVLEPFKKLAKIANFETILTVNFDNFMERAFEADGMKDNAISSINFSIQGSSDADDPIDTSKTTINIFNLMGNIHDSDFAMTEEMQLEYLFRILTGKDARTKTLFNSIKDKSFLLIGCSFPNWFMRFFIRTISTKRYKSGKSQFVASDHTSQDIDLSSFLEINKTSVIPIGVSVLSKKNEEETYLNTVEFIDELFDKAESSSNVITDSEPRYEETVFLSYSWGDKSVITKMKNEFDKCRIKLFFDDDDLRNGEDYAEAITDYINTCDYIIPIISENSLARKESYVYSQEWTQAIMIEQFRNKNNMFKEGQKTYIRPFIIDDTSPSDNRIPAIMRKRNIDKISPEEGFDKMVRNFIKENKLTEITPENG